LIIIQDTKYPDFKLDGISRVMNNMLEFLHSLTVGYMVRWRFQSTYLLSYKLIFIKEQKFHKPLSRQ